MNINRSGFNHFFGRITGMAMRGLRNQLEANLSRAGLELHAEHMVFLSLIKDNEGINQQQLTECMFQDKTATTRWIDNLEDKQLVIRVPDKVDRRQNKIFLTNSGRDLIPKLQEIASMTEKQALEGIDLEKVEICKEVLHQVRLNLEE